MPSFRTFKMPATPLGGLAARLRLRRSSTKVAPFDGEMTNSVVPGQGETPAADTESRNLVNAMLDDSMNLADLVAKAEEITSRVPFSEVEDDIPNRVPCIETADEGAEMELADMLATMEEIASGVPYSEMADECADMPGASSAGESTERSAASSADDEDTKSVDSLTCSELSEDMPELHDLSRPPLMPGGLRVHPEEEKSEFDGHWVLCSPKGTTADWLDSLTISGTQVVDGQGGLCRLREGRKGPTLFKGRLKAKGDVLFRIGKTGCVQCYLRAK